MTVLIHFCSTCGEFTAITTGIQCVKCADSAPEMDRPPVEFELPPLDESGKLIAEFIKQHGFDPTGKTSP